MNETLNIWVRSICKKDSLNDCSVQELRHIVNQHPYFISARLLLLEKLKTADPDSYEKELPATSLYFNNPLWLDYLLNGYKTGMSPEKHLPAEEITPVAVVEAQQPEQPETPEIQPVAETAAQSPSNNASADEEMILTFEPYHTVDYFASQGIKLVQEEKPKDKFGQQLKSFTEWLKTMKKLPQAESVKCDQVSEQKVQQLADTSIVDENVVTEAMAEVWIKQKNTEKAIEVYQKLSLLNPDKSSYFASLIDQIKNS